MEKLKLGVKLYWQIMGLCVGVISLSVFMFLLITMYFNGGVIIHEFNNVLTFVEICCVAFAIIYLISNTKHLVRNWNG